MSVSGSEARPAWPSRAEAWRLPSKHEAAARALSALTGGDDRSGSLDKALQQLGGGWLRRGQLAALGWQRWRSCSDCPLDVMLDLQVAWYVAVGDAELLRREFVNVLTALNNAGLRPVVFKGAALAHSVYPDPACRSMGDLDVWLTVDEMPRARAALESIGYRFDFNSDRPPALMAMHNGEVRLYGPDSAAGLVELHFGVFAGVWLRRVSGVDEVGIRARCRPVRVAGAPVWTLAPEDHLIQIAVHNAVNHQMSLAPLRSLVDVTLLARHQPLDWEAVIQRARAWRLATATWLVLALAQDLCGLDEAAAAVKALAPSRLRQKLIGRFANAEALVEMRDLSKSRWRYVYLLLMVDRGRDAARLVLRTLWPEADWLQARYGRSDARTRLRHALNAARGII